MMSQQSSVGQCSDAGASAVPLRKSLAKSRRKSLRTFFALPVSTHSSSIASLPDGTTTVGSLPVDIVREVVDRLPPSDILNFSLTSTHLRQLLLPALYDTVVLKSSRACRTALFMLKEKSYLCRYIKKLAVRPNYYLAWPEPDDFLEEAWVATMLIDISSDLSLLDTFDWDGLELPPDKLWGALRRGCSNLKSISTNIGRHPLRPRSQLFSFSGLRSFSIIARHGIHSEEPVEAAEQLPNDFWDMILQRSPDLEELAICTFSPSARQFNFDRIVEGSWPSLHSLTLGSFGYTNDFSLGPSTLATSGRLSEFLRRHDSIKYLRFLWNFRHFMSPDKTRLTLPPNSLPALSTFIGIYQQLTSLPSPDTIETLDLTCEPIYHNRVSSLTPILRGLPNLTSLEIWVHLFDSNRDHTLFFHSILSSCPKLTDLHFMCTNSFTSKPLKHLVSGLHTLPNLKRFSLTKGHRYIDESMLESAVKILKASPKLQQINVRWARERCPNHLKQEGNYDVVFDEASGLPTAIVALEKGIRLMGSPFCKRYRHPVKWSAGDWQKAMVGTTRTVKKRVSRVLSFRQSVAHS